MRRREFAFWIGMGLFGLSDRFNLQGLDRLAALAMDVTDPSNPTAPAVHWSIGENASWRWFERETLVHGEWKLTGITTPINKLTGERYTAKTGYLEDGLAPESVLKGKTPSRTTQSSGNLEVEPPESVGKASDSRRARHGRPPSQWLRSLNADELRVWLQTIDVPEAGVSGMTFWTHLTRDHSFDPERIEGLSEAEMAKLHAAAHYGY